MDNEVLEKSEQVLQLREKVLRAERERINAENTISLVEAKKRLREYDGKLMLDGEYEWGEPVER